MVARKSPWRHAAQLLQIAIGEDRMRQLQRVAVLRRLVEDVALGADVAGERHHHLFADRVDRRIGDLREQLLEVVEQRLRLVGQARQRRVGAHRADRLFALDGHGRRGTSGCLRRCSRRRAGAQERVVIGAVHARRLGQLIERDLVLLQPLAVGLAAVRGAALISSSGTMRPSARDRPATSCRAAGGPCLHVLRLDRQHAGFRRHDDQVVVRDQVARRDAGRCDRASRRSRGRR